MSRTITINTHVSTEKKERIWTYHDMKNAVVALADYESRCVPARDGLNQVICYAVEPEDDNSVEKLWQAPLQTLNYACKKHLGLSDGTIEK